MSDEHVLMTTNPRRAWHDGRAAGRAEVAVVLLDLIAELRRSAKGYLSPGAYAITVKEQLWLADWAEARLREVQGE